MIAYGKDNTYSWVTNADTLKDANEITLVGTLDF